MAANSVNAEQAQFVRAVMRLLVTERRKQKLTQLEVAHRTNGAVTKASLANYETGHRSLRIEVAWVIARALNLDIGTICQRASAEVLDGAGHAPTPEEDGYDPGLGIVIDLNALHRSSDPDLMRIVRWYRLDTDRRGLRLKLNPEAVTALANYTGRTEIQLVRWLNEQRVLIKS